MDVLEKGFNFSSEPGQTAARFLNFEQDPYVYVRGLEAKLKELEFPTFIQGFSHRGGYVGSGEYEKVIRRSWMDLHGGRRTRPSGLAGRVDDLFYGPFDEVYEEFVRDRGFPRLPQRKETLKDILSKELD
jgi:hypothetical protein